MYLYVHASTCLYLPSYFSSSVTFTFLLWLWPTKTQLKSWCGCGKNTCLPCPVENNNPQACMLGSSLSPVPGGLVTVSPRLSDLHTDCELHVSWERTWLLAWEEVRGRESSALFSQALWGWGYLFPSENSFLMSAGTHLNGSGLKQACLDLLPS